MSQREFHGRPVSIGVGGSTCAHGRCQDPDTMSPSHWLPTGHRREWLCPHHGRAAAQDCAVSTGGGQGPQAPRRPKANHSPLRTGMYPALWLVWVCLVLFSSGSYSTRSRRIFHFSSLWRNRSMELAHLRMFLWCKHILMGNFQNFGGDSMALVIN